MMKVYRDKTGGLWIVTRPPAFADFGKRYRTYQFTNNRYFDNVRINRINAQHWQLQPAETLTFTERCEIERFCQHWDNDLAWADVEYGAPEYRRQWRYNRKLAVSDLERRIKSVVNEIGADIYRRARRSIVTIESAAR